MISLFAGLASEWHALLSLGVSLRAVFAVDSDQRLRAVWDRQVEALLRADASPQPPASSSAGVDSGPLAPANTSRVGYSRLAPDFDRGLHQLPGDVHAFHPSDLLPIHALLSSSACDVLVVGGWPCQPRSAAGRGRGRSDPRSSAFDAAIYIIRTLQLRWPDRLRFLLENVAVSERSAPAVRDDEEHVRRFLPKPAVFDAADVGSPTRRLRAWYTNLLEPAEFLAWLSRQPVARLPLAQCLDAGSRPRRALPADARRHPGVNMLAEPLVVGPTVLSSASAWGSDAEPAPVLTGDKPRCLNPEERERALGHPAGLTAGYSDSLRCQLLGNSFDTRALRALLLFSLQGDAARLPPASLRLPAPRRAPVPDQLALQVERRRRAAQAQPSPSAGLNVHALAPADGSSRIAYPGPAELRLALPDAAAVAAAAATSRPRGSGSRSPRETPIPRLLGRPVRPPPPASSPEAAAYRDHPHAVFVCEYVLDHPGATRRFENEYSPLPPPDAVLRAVYEHGDYNPLLPAADQPALSRPIFYLTTADGKVLGGEIDPNDHPILTALHDAEASKADLPPPTKPAELQHDINPNLSPEQRQLFVNFLREMEAAGVFTQSIDTLGKYCGPMGPMRFKLITTDLSSAYQRRRTLSPMASQAFRTAVGQLLEAKLIEPSTSPVAANPLVVLKKDGSARVCIDYRDLNNITEPNRQPLPSIPALFHYILSERQANIFSTLDLAQGFHQLPIAEDQRYLTAFYGPDNQLFQYTHMPFGIRNGPPEFQPRVQASLRGVPAAVVFVDDGTISTRIADLQFHPPKPPPVMENGAPGPLELIPTTVTWDLPKHLEDCRLTCLALRKDGWTLKWQKCRWGYFVATQLGHYLSCFGIQPMNDKVAAVNSLQPPTTTKQIKRFLGMAGYYRTHIKDFSALAAPLTQLLKKDVKFTWGAEQQAGFQAIQAALTSAPVLRPADVDKPFIVTCDWSTYGMGATLEQLDDDQAPYVVEYWSKTCTPAEAKYGSFKGEAATLVYAALHWRSYLINGKVNRYRSDNSALQWLLSSPNLPAQAARWALLLQEMVFDVEHIPGSLNVVNDYFSRPTAETAARPPTVPWPTSAEAAASQLSNLAVLTLSSLLADLSPAPARRLLPSSDGGADEPAAAAAVGARLDFCEQAILTAALHVAWGQTALSLFVALAGEREVVRLSTAPPPPPRASPYIFTLWRPSRHERPPPAGFQRRLLPVGLRPGLRVCALTTEPSPSEPLVATPADEIWHDANTIRYLRAAASSPPSAAADRAAVVLQLLSSDERHRVRQRARFFFFQQTAAGEEQLLHLSSEGTGRHCPPPGQRLLLLTELHAARSGLNHLGVARTYAAAARTYWWKGLHRDVVRVVSSCSVCDRQKARALPPAATLNPLPVRSLFFRLHSDLCGPFEPSSFGNVYVMVTADSFTGAIFLSGIPSKQAAQTARVAQQIIALLGAPAEWITDNGGEWQGEFEAALSLSLVDHRTTSSYRPQSNGRAERCVQVVKQLLRRLLAEARPGEDFDSLLPGIMLAYNCSVQRATGFAPYTLMYGREVLVPVAARAALRDAIDPSDPDTLVSVLEQRARLLAHAVPIAAGNRLIAQARDSLQYARRRSGQYTVGLRDSIAVGDPVYLIRHSSTGLSLGVRQTILQVVMAQDNGVLRLQGRDGRCISEHRTNVAPCHLPDLDLTVHPELASVPIDLSCEVCELDDTAGSTIILCSMCSSGWHWPCLLRRRLASGSAPSSSAVWYCPYCVQLRVLPVAVNRDGIATSAAVRAATQRRRPDRSHSLTISVLSPIVSGLTTTNRPPDLRTPSSWVLPGDSAAVLRRLCNLMPGPWALSHATRLASRVPATIAGISPTALFVRTSAPEYEPLRDALDWSRIPAIWDPWAGLGSTADALGAVTVVCLTDIVRRTPELAALANALESADVSAVCEAFGPFCGVVASPWFEFSDLALSAANSAASHFVALHVSHNYLFSAPPPRAAFLQRLSQDGRLFVTANLPRGGHGFRAAWLLVFKTRAIRDSLVRPELLRTSESLFRFSSAPPAPPPALPPPSASPPAVLRPPSTSPPLPLLG